MIDGLTRRLALTGATAAGMAALAVPGGAQPSGSAPRRTFVLVHGAWHGGWCWRRVADLLEKKGHKVFTPTMTGLGERSNLLTRGINVSTHVDDIINTLLWENLSDIVLVGHSYGGAVISGVAERQTDKIASIVFLDAFMPENGESLAEQSTPAFRDVIQGAIARNEISFKSPPASAFGVQGEDGRWVDSKTTPQPAATFSEKAVYTGGREKIARKTFIRATKHVSPTFDANLAKVKSNPAWKTHEMACGHDVMVIDPERLTDILFDA